MKKIRFIKENDLFDWEVGDILETEKTTLPIGEVYVPTQGGCDSTYLRIDNLIEMGYTEWVIEEEEKENNLVDRVNEYIKTQMRDRRYEPSSPALSKYGSILLYDDIVRELNDTRENKHFITGYYIVKKNGDRDKDDGYKVCPVCPPMEILLPARDEKICQAIIDSELMRAYLDRIYSDRTETVANSLPL